MADLSVRLGSLALANPVLAAAGTFGYGLEFAERVQLARLGAVVTKTLTREPREGNPPPRLVETPSGMLNAVGLQNIGLARFLAEQLPKLRPHGATIIVSLLAETPEDVAAMVRAVDQADGAAGIELNLSCPNLKREGTARPPLVSQDPDATARLVEAARRATRKPLFAKLTPDVTDLAPIAQAAERAGADALTISNTYTGMSLDPVTRASRLGALTGGLSGPAIRPLAVYRAWYTAQHVRVPVIGLGGIVRAEDAVEFFLAGATAVAVGTATFADPRAPARLVDGLDRFCRRHGLGRVAELRGALKP